MSAPYYVRILLEPYADHPLIGHAITDCLAGNMGVGPMFGRLLHPSGEALLSTGEVATIHWAMALWNGSREARVADLFLMDADHQQRACDAAAAKFIYPNGEEE